LAANDFQAFIIELLKRDDLSATALAERLDVAPSTITRLLDASALTRPSVDLALKIADYAHVDAVTLLALAFPAIRKYMDVSPGALLMAQQIEQAPKHIQDVIRSILRGN
jgi:transcriptional regulator with XRE-family HTH domain